MPALQYHFVLSPFLPSPSSLLSSLPFPLPPPGTVFVADTNNSVIRILDLSQSPAAVSTLTLTDVPSPAPPSYSSSSTSSEPAKRKSLRRRQAPEAEVVTVAAVGGSAGTLQLRIAIPDGYHFTEVRGNKGALQGRLQDRGERG